MSDVSCYGDIYWVSQCHPNIFFSITLGKGIQAQRPVVEDCEYFYQTLTDASLPQTAIDEVGLQLWTQMPELIGQIRSEEPGLLLETLDFFYTLASRCVKGSPWTEPHRDAPVAETRVQKCTFTR